MTRKALYAIALLGLSIFLIGCSHAGYNAATHAPLRIVSATLINATEGPAARIKVRNLSHSVIQRFELVFHASDGQGRPLVAVDTNESARHQSVGRTLSPGQSYETNYTLAPFGNMAASYRISINDVGFKNGGIWSGHPGYPWEITVTLVRDP